MEQRKEGFHRGVIPGSTHSTHGTHEPVILQGVDELSASKLTTPVRVNNAPTDIAAPGDSVIEGVNSEAGFHSVGDGVSDDAPGGHVAVSRSQRNTFIWRLS